MNNDQDIWRQGTYFVHNISTPTATLQLNLGVLAQFLPILIDHYRCSGAEDTLTLPTISPETLTALQKLTDPMLQSVATIREQTREFSTHLQRHPPRDLAPQPTAEKVVERAGSADIAYPIQRMLIIEDEEIHQQVALKQLEGLCQVDIANNGLEAIEKCQNQTYDLILMDFVLPGMRAPAILQRMAASGAPHPLVIGFTNLPEIPDEYANTAIPIAAYLGKPFKLTSFEALLTHLNLSLGKETQM